MVNLESVRRVLAGLRATSRSSIRLCWRVTSTKKEKNEKRKEKEKAERQFPSNVSVRRASVVPASHLRKDDNRHPAGMYLYSA
jgi:hypothetical protein